MENDFENKCHLIFFHGSILKSNSLLHTKFLWNVGPCFCQVFWTSCQDFRNPWAYKTMSVAPWMMILPGATSTEILGYLLKFLPSILYCKINNSLKWGNWNWIVSLKRTMQWSHQRFLLPILVWWCHWKLLKSKKLKVREKIPKHQIPSPLVGVLAELCLILRYEEGKNTFSLGRGFLE